MAHRPDPSTSCITDAKFGVKNDTVISTDDLRVPEALRHASFSISAAHAPRDCTIVSANPGHLPFSPPVHPSSCKKGAGLCDLSFGSSIRRQALVGAPRRQARDSAASGR
jgi:hypothetical protein